MGSKKPVLVGLSEKQLPIRKTLSQNGPENVVFKAVGVGRIGVRKTVGFGTRR
jgi:hypothetical protein